MALPKAHRLRYRKDFNQVYQVGLRRHSSHLILRALHQSRQKPISGESTAVTVVEEQFTRIGISISQKVSKRAVVRNRIKRQIRAALQQFLPSMKPGWRLVIVVKPSAVQCDYEQFLQELKQLLIGAEVINGY